MCFLIWGSSDMVMYELVVTPKVLLSKKHIDAIVPTYEDEFYHDAQLTGFTLKVMGSYRRTSSSSTRMPGTGRSGKVHRYSVGEYGDPLHTQAARNRAKVLLGQVAAGINPQEEKKEQTRAVVRCAERTTARSPRL